MDAVTWHAHGCLAAFDACSEYGGLQPIAQHPAAADALQPPLRCGFQARLSRSVRQIKDKILYLRGVWFQAAMTGKTTEKMCMVI
jgi:hypothetical protein